MFKEVKKGFEKVEKFDIRRFQLFPIVVGLSDKLMAHSSVYYVENLIDFV